MRARVRRDRRESDAFGDAHEISERANTHLLHDAGTMDLDCLLDGAEVDRDLLVELARDHMLKDFAFARRQPVESLVDRRGSGA